MNLTEIAQQAAEHRQKLAETVYVIEETYRYKCRR